MICFVLSKQSNEYGFIQPFLYLYAHYRNFVKKTGSIISYLLFCLATHAQVIDFDYSPDKNCDTARITFTDKSTLIDTSNFTCAWNFSNGESYNTDKYYKRNPPVQKYEHAGSYSVFYYIGSNFKSKTVKINQSPNPFFQILDTPDSTTYTLKANDLPLPASSYHWFIESYDTLAGYHQYDTLLGNQFTHTFTKKKNIITLTIIDTTQAHCQSTYIKELYASKELEVFNVIIPNSDNFFTVPTNGTTQYQLYIYTRGGLLIFKSDGPRIWWDGYLSSGELAKPGTYFYVIESPSPMKFKKNKKPEFQNNKNPNTGFLQIIY